MNDSMFVSRSRLYPRSCTVTVNVAPRYPSTSLATEVTVPSKTVPSRSSYPADTETAFPMFSLPDPTSA